jgi:hypothetical protein
MLLVVSVVVLFDSRTCCPAANDGLVEFREMLWFEVYWHFMLCHKNPSVLFHHVYWFIASDI